MSELPPISWINGVAEYAGYIGLAFAGSFLRANKWQNDATGKIVWGKVLFEIPVSLAVGAVAIGIGDYKHVSKPIVGGLCALLGLLGPAFFTGLGDTVLSILQNKFGK